MNVKDGYLYAESHEWAQVENGKAKIGISDFAQHEMGDIVFVNLPEVGDTLQAGQPFTDIESVKAVSDVYAPLSGKVTAVNEALADTPELLNNDCYGAWIVEIEEIDGEDSLLDAEAYKGFLAKEA